MTKKSTKLVADLPKGITKDDLERPHWDAKGSEKQAYDKESYRHLEFGLWYTEALGWVIPTLFIGGGRRAAQAGSVRTYATTIDGKVCRVGMGPHVKQQLTVYVRVGRRAALQPYLDLQEKGQADAGQVRDRISTRRAQGQLHRQAGHTSWTW